MARLEYFLVAEDVAVDQTTNLISLFNVFEELRPAGFPLLVPKLAAVAMWQREPDDEGRDFQSILRIVTPTGQIHQMETNFRMTSPRHRIINRVGGLPILAAGELRFEILLNGQHAASHIVSAEVAPPQEAAGVAH